MNNILLSYVRLHHYEFIKFIVVGMLTAIIYVSCFHLFYGIAHFDYRIAASIAYGVTLCSHFLLHRTFTFAARGQKVFHNIWKYVLMLLSNYISLLLLMWACVSMMNVSPYIGIIASTSITIMLNFFMLKHFVFG